MVVVLIAPLLPPKQLTFVLLATATFSAAAGCEMLAVVLAVQPLLSVTVTLYVPADSAVRFALLFPSFQL